MPVGTATRRVSSTALSKPNRMPTASSLPTTNTHRQTQGERDRERQRERQREREGESEGESEGNCTRWQPVVTNPPTLSLSLSLCVCLLFAMAPLPPSLTLAWLRASFPATAAAPGCHALSLLLATALYLLAADLDRPAFALTLRGLTALDALAEHLPQHPAGLKLNVALANAFVAAFHHALRVWLASLLLLSGPRTASAARLFLAAAAALGGLGGSLALVVDLLQLLALHITTAHLLAAAFYRGLLALLASLLLLFVGKKHNPLRGRVDTHRTSTAHTLIAALLLVVGLFLLPTVAVAHAFFALVGPARPAVEPSRPPGAPTPHCHPAAGGRPAPQPGSAVRRACRHRSHLALLRVAPASGLAVRAAHVCPGHAQARGAGRTADSPRASGLGHCGCRIPHPLRPTMIGAVGLPIPPRTCLVPMPTQSAGEVTASVPRPS